MALYAAMILSFFIFKHSFQMKPCPVLAHMEAKMLRFIEYLRRFCHIMPFAEVKIAVEVKMAPYQIAVHSPPHGLMVILAARI